MQTTTEQIPESSSTKIVDLPSELESRIFCDDARNLGSYLADNSVDVTITSPPYFDLKDYGHSNQVGFGQTYEAYLLDLQKIFADVYRATKRSGSLWIIVNTFKRNGSVVPLPFDLARHLTKAGWILQDIIIWKKDRTLPWSHKGSTRSIFEYILFFSKSPDFKYFDKRERETADLKEWWVKYPERYNPSGKALDEIWEFGIPTQGSWGSGMFRHFCPLPPGLARRIISLTTDENDTVVDPFAGTGTVLSQASFMRRNYVGTELNADFIEQFRLYHDIHVESSRRAFDGAALAATPTTFTETVLNLRLLKYGRVLVRKLNAAGARVKQLYIDRSDGQALRPGAVVGGSMLLLLDEGTSAEEVSESILRLTESPPLSKFGVDSTCRLLYCEQEFWSSVGDRSVYRYSLSNTHDSKGQAKVGEPRPSDAILSSIEVKINRDMYRSYE